MTRKCMVFSFTFNAYLSFKQELIISKIKRKSIHSQIIPMTNIKHLPKVLIQYIYKKNEHLSVNQFLHLCDRPLLAHGQCCVTVLF